MERLFGLDSQLLFEICLTAISVFVLFTALSYILFNPVRDMLKKRQQMVQDTRESAEKDKADAAALKDEYDNKVRNAQAEAETILSDARKRAIKNEKAILEEAREEAARMIASANKEIELEKKKAMDDLKQQVVEIAAQMAGKAVAATLSENVQNQLIEETLKEMGESTWQS